MTLPSLFRPAAQSEFIGPARQACLKVERLIELSRAASKAPIKLLLLGKPGIGKSELAEHFCRAIAASKWSTSKYNGTSFRMEDVEELSRSVRLKNLYGDYRVIWIEEVDRVPSVAQVRMLTFLDDLPGGNAIVATSNMDGAALEERFRSRFQRLLIEAPSVPEISEMLKVRWEIPVAIATPIAALAAGNVRQALLHAQSYLLGT
jgi:MoxR-like ATPase